MTKKTFETGEEICRDGSPGLEMYIIQYGKVGVFKSMNGKKLDLGTIGKNDCFGEMSLFLNSKRTASIIALEKTEVMILDKESVLEHIKTDPNFAFTLIAKLSHKIQEAHDVINKIEGERRSFEILYKMK